MTDKLNWCLKLYWLYVSHITAALKDKHQMYVFL